MQGNLEYRRGLLRMQHSIHVAPTDNLGAVLMYLPPRRNMMETQEVKELSSKRRQ
jgi:hypothetical protein